MPNPKGKMSMLQRRLRVVKWLSTTPALGVCTLCNREFNVPLSALRRTADAQASLQEQFDRHKCEPEEPSQTPDVLLRRSQTRTRTKRKKKRKKTAKTMAMMTTQPTTDTRSERALICVSR
jgi:hypothetical protein